MMSRLPLHLGHVSSLDPKDVNVIESYPKAYGFVEVAIELWRLAGRDDRASAIHNVIASSVDYNPPRLERAQIEQLRSLLGGLEAALIGPLTDQQHLLSHETVQKLRGHAQTLDLADAWGSLPRDPRYAVQEALVFVEHLRTILDEALAAGASILF